MNPIFEHLYDNWRAVYSLPLGDERTANMKNVRMLSRGNLHWFIRQLIGGVPSDGEDFINKKIAAGEMLAPTEDIRRLRHENRKRKNQQHS